MIAQRFTTTPSGLESAPAGARPARRLALVPADPEAPARPGVRRYRLARGAAAPPPAPAPARAETAVPSAM
jgi:hypothetical protein